jgi:hypothetical protein
MAPLPVFFSWLVWDSDETQGEPETDAEILMRGDSTISMMCPAMAGVASRTTASNDPPQPFWGANRVIFWRLGIVICTPIIAPFEHIPMHIEQSKWVRF